MINDLLEVYFTGKVFPKKTVSVEFGTTEINYSPFNTQREYLAELKIQCTFLSDDENLGKAKEYAIANLKHELYNDIEGDVLKLLNLCDDERMESILLNMLTKMRK